MILTQFCMSDRFRGYRDVNRSYTRTTNGLFRDANGNLFMPGRPKYYSSAPYMIQGNNGRSLWNNSRQINYGSYLATNQNLNPGVFSRFGLNGYQTTNGFPNYGMDNFIFNNLFPSATSFGSGYTNNRVPGSYYPNLLQTNKINRTLSKFIPN